MTISVVVPAYNAERTIEACLASLQRQTVSIHDVIVVNDASTDGTGAAARRHGALVIDRRERGGAGVARAEGAARATGAVIAFIDADCIAPSDWIERIIHEFGTYPELGGVGGPYRYEQPTTLSGSVTKLEREYAYAVYSRHPYDANPPGGNCAFRRDVWNEHRTGRELVFFRRMASGEDTVLCSELRRFTKIKYVPSLRVTHEETTHVRDYFRRQVNRGRSRTIIILHGLSSASDPTVKGNGGLPLFAAGLALITAALGSVLAPFFPFAAGTVVCASLAVHAWLYLPFSRFIRMRRPSRGERAIGPGKRVQIRVLLALRSIAWIVGAATTLAETAGSAAVRYWNIAASLLHIWTPGRISRLFYFVTAKCNAGCDFCFNRHRVRRMNERELRELTLPEIEQIARHFGRLPYITYSGGEPFLREDLPDIVAAFVKRSRTQWVTIPTNASQPAAVRRMVSEILYRCPGIFLTVQVSLDGIFDRHDASRKIDGAFSAAARTLLWLGRVRAHAGNLRVQIATCYGDSSREHVRDLIRYCREHFEYDQHVFHLVRDPGSRITASCDRLIGELQGILEGQEGVEKRRRTRTIWNRLVTALQRVTYSDLIRIKTTGEHLRRCHATEKFVTLYEDGTIVPCEMLPAIELGDLRERNYDMSAIIRKGRVKEFRRKVLREGRCTCDWSCAVSMNMLYDLRTFARIAGKGRSHAPVQERA